MRFADYGKRVVFAAFDGGEITSDAGVLLLREQARRIHLFERMAGCSRISHQDLVVFRFSSYNQCISADSDGL